jgi:hypothetical protein
MAGRPRPRQDGSVIEHIPIQRGDVLILWTRQSFEIHAVGQISQDGQQDFHRRTAVRHISDRTDAVTEARARVAADRTIFLRDMDTGQWSEIPRHAEVSRVVSH